MPPRIPLNPPRCRTADTAAHAAARAHARTRAATISAAESLISELQKTVVFLVLQGVFVIGFSGRRHAGIDQVIVRVAPTPYLHILFPDCAWRERRQEGALTIFTWFAFLGDVRIEWEELCA